MSYQSTCHSEVLEYPFWLTALAGTDRSDVSSATGTGPLLSSLLSLLLALQVFCHRSMQKCVVHVILRPGKTDVIPPYGALFLYRNYIAPDHLGPYMYEAAFGLKHNSLYAEVTKGHRAHVQMWCNNHCDLLHIIGKDAEKVVSGLESKVGVEDVIRQENELVLVTRDCLLEHEANLLEAYLERHQCLSLPPRTYAAGKITTRVIALTEESLGSIYTDLSDDYEITVEAKREIDAITPDVPLMMTNSELPSLTKRQEDALASAYAEGYYEIPRSCTTADIAAELGVGRRTAEEHLRIAEQKVMDGFVAYLVDGGKSRELPVESLS